MWKTSSRVASRILRTTSLAAMAAWLGTSGALAGGSSGRSGPDPMADALARTEQAQEPKFRWIYTDDAEIDGLSEFMRMLLYSSDFSDSLQGIVYSSSQFHYRGDPSANPAVPPYGWSGGDLPNGVDRLTTFQSIIAGGGYFGADGGYAGAFANLRKHDPRYPTPQHLLSLVRVGNVDNVGEMQKVTDGSTLIKNALLAKENRPLWLVAGGGTNTIAAALDQAKKEYADTLAWPAIRQHIIATTHLYIIADQDNTFAKYIKVEWPDLNVTLSRAQWLGIAYDAGRSQFLTPYAQSFFSASFEAQIAQGPMLATYPLSSPEQASSGPAGSLLSDGDAPMYYNLLPNGLRSEEDPTYGGWGGRFQKVADHGWTDIPAYFLDPASGAFGPSTVADSGSGSTSASVAQGYPLGRWIPAIQNDMLARSRWQTADYAHANHPPAVLVPQIAQNITARPGQVVPLVALAADPDGRRLSTRWYQYPEAGTYPGTVVPFSPTHLATLVAMPTDAKPGQTIHLILEVTNDGSPPLTRYQRVILTCK
jgi:hypothetical protein